MLRKSKNKLFSGGGLGSGNNGLKIEQNFGNNTNTDKDLTKIKFKIGQKAEEIL